MRHSLGLLLLALSGSIHAQDSLNVHKLFHWDDPSIPVGASSLQDQYNDIWGYAANGREYAFLGSSLGVHIFDVTDAETSVLVDHVPGRFSGTDVIHRDYKVYHDHLFAVCDEGPSSLQVMDLSYLPDSVHLVYDSNALLQQAHDIQIDTANARMYTCGGSSNFSVYDISDPENPALLTDCEADVPWWGALVGYVHDCFVRDNIVWCNDGDGMHVVDFTDALNPVLLGSLTTYPGQGYNHSGWMNDAGTLYVMADETHGSPLKFVDPTDLSDLQVISTVTSGVAPTSIVHNPFFNGDLVHVAYYYDGYWLWNLSDPLWPILLGYYDTNPAPNTNGFRGAWGVYPFLPSGHVLVSDMQTGLWVLDIDQATNTSERITEPTRRIWPTVTSGRVNVMAVNEAGSKNTIEVLDARGAVVMRSTMSGSNGTVDLGDLPDGMFIVHVVNAHASFTQRVVKNSAR